MRILGIDPGTAIMGYGVIDKEGNHARLVTYGCVRTQPHTPLPDRLLAIYEEIGQVISDHKPDSMGIEEVFFSRNVTTAISVGHARGVALLLAKMNQLTIGEYTPNQIKQGVSGYGSAGKRQVQEMVRIILNMKEIPKPDDAADALAVAICHGQSSGRLGRILEGRL